MLCFLLGLGVLLIGVIVLIAIGLPFFRLIDGGWPSDGSELGICCLTGAIVCLILPVLGIAIYSIGCLIRGAL